MSVFLLHMGFHKTGTTSLQRAMMHNRPLYRDRIFVVPRHMVAELGVLARYYSDHGDPISLAEFGSAALETFHKIETQAKGRKVFLSFEELSGHLPGRPRVPNYRAALPLARCLAEILKAEFPQFSPKFCYSTRDPSSWLESTYAQHLKSSALMTLEWPEFRARFEDALEVEGVLEKIKAAISPLPLVTWNISEVGDVFTPVFDILELPESDRSAFEAQTINTRLPDRLNEKLLEMNRNGGDKDKLAQSKRTLIQKYRRGEIEF